MNTYRLLWHPPLYYNKTYAAIKSVYISIMLNFKNKGSRHRVSRKLAKALLNNPSDDDPPFVNIHRDAEFTLTISKFGIFAVIAYFGCIRTVIPETSGQRFGIIRTAFRHIRTPCRVNKQVVFSNQQD